MIAELHGVQKRFKGKRVLEDINLTINENEIVGIVGEMVQAKRLF
ncbi:hypothetical protein QKW52_11175 [Bacillus sonorensis]|nr:hypothetical protein [Bacillus sonorensis]